jgi:hypothetical protein
LYVADTSEPVTAKATAKSRIRTLATKLLTTVKTLTEDVAPLGKATDEELARHWRADWPAFRKRFARPRIFVSLFSMRPSLPARKPTPWPALAREVKERVSGIIFGGQHLVALNYGASVPKLYHAAFTTL